MLFNVMLVLGLLLLAALLHVVLLVMDPFDHHERIVTPRRRR